MTNYTRKSNTEWEWQQGNHHRTVRYFVSTDKLIWSGWTDTSNGPVFEEGFAQPVENFLQGGISHIDVPDDLLNELRSVLSQAKPKAKKGFLSWLNKGN